MSQLQDLRARMRLDNAQFSRGLRQARGETESFGRAIGNMMRSLAAPLAGALSFRAIISGAQRGAQEIDQVAKSARALDGSVGGVRAVELAMSEAGVSASVFRQEMQNLNRAVADGRAGTAMQALGIETREFIRLDADQKIALIADRVRELGLDAGSTNAILSQFGIRNRDMALLVMQGGDAIRDARRDIQDYGLALSEIDAGRIEQANDQIGRLSLVSQYLRQELALQLTPALGSFAQAITESMREGGSLRGVIDSLVDLVPRLSAYVSVAAAGAVVYGVAIAGITTAKWLLVAASNGLRAALMRLGFPVLVLAAGEMAFRFSKLVDATGGWAQALDELKNVSSAVADWIRLDFQRLGVDLHAVWKDIQAGFFTMLESMSTGFSNFMGNFRPLSNLPSFGITQPFRLLGDAANATTDAVQKFSSSASEAAGQADRLRAQARQLAAEGYRPVGEALERIRAIMDRSNNDGAEYSATMREIYRTLDDIGGGDGGGGGGAAGRAAAGVRAVAAATDDAARAQEQWANSMAGHFDGLITGGKNLSGVLQSMARQLESRGWQALFSGLGGGGGGGFFRSLFAGFFDGGGHIPRGKFGIAAERRSEFVNGVLVPGPANVTGGAETARMMGGGQTVIRLELSQDIEARILGEARGQTVQIVRTETPQMIRGAFSQARERRAFD